MANAAPPPNNDVIADKQGNCSQSWLLWFTDIINRLTNSSTQIKTVSLTGQGASIAATDMTNGTLSAGLYQVQYYQRVTTAAGVSSSLTFTLAFTDHGVSMSFSGAAMNGNTTTTAQQDTVMFYSDGGTPITYATTYASNAAGVMRYEFFAVLSSVAV